MNIDDHGTETLSTQTRWLRRCLPVLVALFLGAHGADPASSHSVATPSTFVVRIVINYHIYSPSDLPPKYRAYIAEATPEESVRVGVPCKERQRAARNHASPTYCIETFYPRYPYHRLPAAVKKRLVSSVRKMGGELLDWAFSSGNFVGLGVNDAGSFLLVRTTERGERVESLPPYIPSNFDIISAMDDPHPFCFTDRESTTQSLAEMAAGALARLAMAWREVALVICGKDGGETPFFIFPEQKVHHWWWSKAWLIDEDPRDAYVVSRHPLCNIWWEILDGESGSRRVTIPALDPKDPSRIDELVTLDLRTGQFFIRGKQIYPELPQGESHDEMSRSIRPSTGERSSRSSGQPSDDEEHKGKQQVERPDGD